MDFLKDIISSTAKDVEKQSNLVKGKKWVKRGVVKKISEQVEDEKRRKKKAEAEKLKRKREQEATELLKKKIRKEIRTTTEKLQGRSPGSTASPGSSSPAASTSSSTSNTESSPAVAAKNTTSSGSTQKGTDPPSSSNLMGGDGAEDAADGGSKLILPVGEVIRRLRSMGAPITLFGETDLERLKRMRKVEVEGLDDEGVIHTGTHAMRNVFLKGKAHKEGANEVDDLAEFDDDAEGNEADAEQMGQLGEAGVAMTGAEAEAHAAQERKRKKGDHEVSTETFVLRFFRRMLKEWANDLAARPEHVKNSAEGRVATKTQKQCKDYMRPFLKMCRAKTIEKSILKHAKLIVDACLARNYVFAHEEYMRMAIGNAPWPIGVTNVGIHARVGRENISTSKIAHVLNDERQRKYVTSMKRLLTYCQMKYPTDPSKMVGH